MVGVRSSFDSKPVVDQALVVHIPSSELVLRGTLVSHRLSLAGDMGKRGNNFAATAGRKKDIRRTYQPDTSYVDKLNAALAGHPVASAPPCPHGGPSRQTAPTVAGAPASSSRDVFAPTRLAAPQVVPPARASLTAALDTAASEESRRLAITEFEVAKTANSAKVVRASQWRTYRRLHYAWHPSNVPVLPLTTLKISQVAAMFKAGRYTSYANYMAVAKGEHIAAFDTHGVPWTAELTVAVRDATRSVLRGLGAARQSQPIDAHQIFALNLGADPISAGGPISPSLFAVLGSFFLTREVEIACAGAVDIHINESTEEVVWQLPVSKTDQRALGTTRTWGCVCGGDSALACPYHAAVIQIGRLRAMASTLDIPFTSLPLFPTELGREVTKAAAVDTITGLASLCGARTVDSHGRNLFGGHSLRTGGAVLLTGLGLDSVKVECLGRWHSAMLLHYSRLAPLKSLTKEYRLRTQAVRESNDVHRVADKLSSLEVAMKQISERLDAASTEPVPSFFPSACEIFVFNVKSHIWHFSSVHDVSARSGVSACGWAYNQHNSDERMDSLNHKSGYMYCERCLPKMALSHNKHSRVKHSAASSCSESTE